ncbi:hypothetical protein BJN42_16175 [Pseudomonas koreensis]|nr:hypothetical protein BJN42_16175 [Pseudomonas koreensis]
MVWRPRQCPEWGGEDVGLSTVQVEFQRLQRWQSWRQTLRNQRIAGVLITPAERAETGCQAERAELADVIGLAGFQAHRQVEFLPRLSRGENST